MKRRSTTHTRQPHPFHLAMARRRRGHIASIKKRQEGMTLIEIMVVVAIIAVVGGSAAIVAFGFLVDVKEKIARDGAGTVQEVAEMYRFDNPDCPTVKDLTDSGTLKESKSQDPWRHEFQITCAGDNITVSSAGPDGEFGNDDDITVQ